MIRTHRTARTAKRRTRPRSNGAKRDPFAATPEKMLPFVRALAGDAAARLGTELGAPVTRPSLLAATAASYRQYGEVWGYVQSLHMVPSACQAGCAHCCHLTVETTAPEVFLIAAHLRETRTPAQLEILKERLRRTAARVSGLSPGERVQAALPCALLEDGQCSAYAVRPMGCRSWNSRDADACARVLRDGGGDLRPVQDQRPLGVQAGIQEGFLAALRRAGLPEDRERRCELNTALSRALDNPQSMEQWLGGDDVLAAARKTVRYGG